MTKLLADILREPQELSKSLTHALGQGKASLDDAADLLKESPHICIIGMGSSWNAGLAILSFLHAKGRPALLFDAAELLHFGEVPAGAAAIVLSRSGRSSEIVQLLPRLRARGAKIIALTNTPDSPLALQADVVLHLSAAFDHQVSISMYSSLAMTGCLLAALSLGELDNDLPSTLLASLNVVAPSIEKWQISLFANSWLDATAPIYFLARGASLASCHEARLLWEEAAQVTASAMPTGGFRHGPQEIVRAGLRIGLWLDRDLMRAQDLALARDLKHYGAKVLLIGQDLPSDSADVVLNLPFVPAPWQFLLDIIPMQIAAELLSHKNSQDCDSFRICSYIVEEEGGLIPENKRSIQRPGESE
jgi:glucosamine--fructose-6-phosphate aminotransferase (isomerizing)